MTSPQRLGDLVPRNRKLLINLDIILDILVNICKLILFLNKQQQRRSVHRIIAWT